MLSHISVKNFQSLNEVSLELKPFTVIVGPSSSGKSAFTRALRTLTSNQRGDSFITHGENQCVIKARTDRGTAALLRGKKNEYVLIPEEGDQRVYTKLAGTTPEEVSEFIGIPSRDPLNYSNQFDMPYLLTSSAAEVARELGALTNVNVIYEAAREASRRRLQASSTLKTRAADYADLTKNLDSYRSLKSDQEQLTTAEKLQTSAVEKQSRLDRLSTIIQSIEDIPQLPEARDIPDCSRILEAQQIINRLTTLINESIAAESGLEEANKQDLWYHQLGQDLQAEYLDTLREVGTCPTCGQETSTLDHAGH